MVAVELFPCIKIENLAVALHSAQTHIQEVSLQKLKRYIYKIRQKSKVVVYVFIVLSRYFKVPASGVLNIQEKLQNLVWAKNQLSTWVAWTRIVWDSEEEFPQMTQVET